LRIVSNTSPIVALAHLGELDLLRKIFDSAILIPPAVSRELAGRKLPEWFEIRGLRQPLSATALEAFLGAGESEALALALGAVVYPARSRWRNRRQAMTIDRPLAVWT
jgi:predicted nucleic acid-binding protein